MSMFITNGLPDSCNPLLLRHEGFRTLDQAFERPLVCITGGQGLGKTILVSSYLHERNLPSIWFTLASKEQQYASFYQLLSEGLFSIGAEGEVENELSLLETISKLDRRLVVVLDCAKFTQPEPRLLEFWMRLVQYRSPNLTFVLITRSRLKLPYAKLKAQKKIYEWKPSDLFFNKAEIEAFFQEEAIRLTTEELQRIAFQTGGWPLGISYLATIWKDCTPQDRKELSLLLDDLLLELFSEDNDPSSYHLLKEFTYLSVLHELKTEVVNAYLAEGESDRIWDELGSERFFLQRKEDFSYQILPVVRDFLYRRLIRTEGTTKVNDLHLKVAKIYEDQFQYYYAFAHSLAGNWYVEAARLMQFMMNFYTPDRFLQIMDGSLETICPSISMSTFSLFLFRSVPISILQSYIPSLKKAMGELEKEEDNESLLYVQHRLGLILYYSGKVAEAKALVEKSLETSEKLENEEYVIVNLSVLAQCCRFLGQLDEGLVLARRALARIELYGSYAGKMHTMWILSELLLEKADLSAAKPIIAELLKWLDSYEDTTAWIYAHFVKAKYERLRGNFDVALEWANNGEKAAESYSLTPDLGWACLELGFIYQELHEPDKAIDYFKKSADYFQAYIYFHQLAMDQIANISTAVVQQKSNRNLSEELALPSQPKVQVKSQSSEQEKGFVLNMLGPLKIKRDGEQITIPRKSSLQLLLYLAVNYGKKLQKEQILEEIFPKGNVLAQNNRFYVSMSTLRKALEPGLKSGRDSTLILQDGELFSLHDGKCQLDLAEFESLMKAHSDSPDERMAILLKAETLYQGDLLESYPYESFLEPARERARRLYHQLLLELARSYWEKKDYQNGMNYFDRLLERDEYAETVYWEYIQTLLEHELLHNAKHIADKMVRRLEKELGIPVISRLKMKFPKLK